MQGSSDLLPVPSDTGRVIFHLNGFPDSKVVMLTGTFNNWNEELYRMKRDPTGWVLRLSLPLKEYEYKFIVDGKWMHDPANPQLETAWDGHVNSVLFVR